MVVLGLGLGWVGKGLTFEFLEYNDSNGLGRLGLKMTFEGEDRLST